MMKVPKPWDDICCSRCWHAETKRCRCRCKGEFHGQAHKDHWGPLDTYMKKEGKLEEQSIDRSDPFAYLPIAP